MGKATAKKKTVANVITVKAKTQNIIEHRQMQTRTTNKTCKTDRFSDGFQTVLSLAWNAKFSNGYATSESLAKLQIHSWATLTCGKFKIVVVFRPELEANTLFFFITYEFFLEQAQSVLEVKKRIKFLNNDALNCFFFPSSRNTVDL